MKHASHPDVVLRLKRAQGHLSSVIEMFAEGRPCVDLAQQLHAVEAAIAKAKREMIHDHIEHCLDEEDEGVAASIRDLKQITKYL
ncbi:metal-sensing transcriptional repressor [Solirhodobacter olei]|uniref:metal-sensing transcriptional repressor n=1 Tax=Solirhodobacter olei TaxID=2493082 RepID=UPI000FD9B2CF|nr:metal-sensing transcriptional repressor [Solirhodobacter olei]